MISGRVRCLGLFDNAEPLPAVSAPDAADAAWAARRAAAMKLGFCPGSAITGGLVVLTAASEAAIRSAAEAVGRGRPAAEPGSSG